MAAQPLPEALVSEIQQRLRAIGHRYITPDGLYGPETENAVRVFQREQGLEGDGGWDPQTQIALWHATADVAFSESPPPVPQPEPLPSGDVGAPTPAGWALTDSVQRLDSVFPGHVSAHELAAELLQRHSDYPGRHLVEELREAPPDATRKSVAAWRDDVRPIFHSSLTTLHGQLFILGLALVEIDLGERLTGEGVLQQLVDKIAELPEGFTETGRRSVVELPLQRDDVVPLLGDRPTDADDLDRELFAEVVADRLRYVRTAQAQQGSFLVHVGGPWGSGKSSLLRLLAAQLRRGDPAVGDEPWVVVWFNAWQHQRLAPPWWWLMTTVYREALRELWRLADRRFFLLLGKELGWRLRDGWLAYALVPVAAVLLWVFWTTEFFALTDFGEKGPFEILTFVAGVLGTSTGLAVSLWGILRGVNRWLMFGSARGAHAVLRRGHDPMALVRSRYSSLVRAIDRPVAVLVDDLDRCQPDYVVELLEGIQTLFVEEPVTYVVAADKHWLSDSYAKAYKDFVSQAGEPARPLGYLFLEKTFQLSLRLPHLSPDVRDRYWRNLLRLAREPRRTEEPAPSRLVTLARIVLGRTPEPSSADPAFEQALKDAEAIVEGATNEEQVFRHVAAVEGHDTVQAEAIRKASVKKLKDPKIEARTAHTLEGFAALLEENPRAMKKLVNAYGVERDLQLRRGRVITTQTRKRLAFWTVLGLRWPLLAEFLAERPEAVAWLGDGAGADGVDEATKRLLADRGVSALVLAQDPSVRLTEASLRYILDLGAPDGSRPAGVGSAVP